MLAFTYPGQKPEAAITGSIGATPHPPPVIRRRVQNRHTQSKFTDPMYQFQRILTWALRQNFCCSISAMDARTSMLKKERVLVAQPILISVEQCGSDQRRDGRGHLIFHGVCRHSVMDGRRSQTTGADLRSRSLFRSGKDGTSAIQQARQDIGPYADSAEQKNRVSPLDHASLIILALRNSDGDSPTIRLKERLKDRSSE